MESQSKTTQTVSALKLPVLKTGDYDPWSMRMEQYLTHTDYDLWEVIVNGDAPAIASICAVEAPIGSFHESQKMQRPYVKQSRPGGCNLEVAKKSIYHQLRTNIALIIGETNPIRHLSMYDLYNNLKVYEAEIKGQSSSNSHNVAFVSSDNTSSTNEAVNIAHDVLSF
ncbi:hypothetical protein Tco_1113596 [Tanacetum coccineum]|uniref:DUF4219 domain-containing protein n=1 Tax=Tanacetum coccineum TaxID=301880 RepID=A0ABQ5IVM7_9ASTR